MLESDHHRAVTISPQDPGPDRRQPVQRRPCGMAVGVARAGRGDRDPRPDGVHERLGGGGLAPMVGDLEQVDAGQTVGQQLRVDRLLDVAHEQEASASDLAEEDDRHVVDAGSPVRRLDRHLAADGPQDTECDLVHFQPVARSETTADRCARSGESGDPGDIAGPGSTHPGLEDPTDVIPIQQQRQPGHVILMRVGQDDRVDPTVPRWDALVERDEQSTGIRSAIDEQATSV